MAAPGWVEQGEGQAFQLLSSLHTCRQVSTQRWTCHLPPATDHLLPAVHPPPAAAACTACPLQEAYEGPDVGCEVTGLAPGSQYIFCVKALYDDLMVTTTTTAAAAIKGAKKGSK